MAQSITKKAQSTAEKNNSVNLCETSVSLRGTTKNKR